MAGFRGDLFARGRAVLGRFGDVGDDDHAAWARLVPDFPLAAPDWPALTAEQRAAARAYLRARRSAFGLLAPCEELHARLLRDGIAADLVESYAAARAAYEDAVEAFGAARERLEVLLRQG